MNRVRIGTIAAAAVILLGTGGSVLIARSGDDRSAAAPLPSQSSTPPVRVIEPGRPGESAGVTDSDKVRMPDGQVYNAVDVAFVQMMIVHHQQAVQMADLAPGRAGNKQLGALADRISAAQKPEISVLRQWLTDRQLPETDPNHDHATMPGMQTDAAMASLTAAKGAEFDRKFADMMTVHHKGAQQMALDVIRGGIDQLLSEQANEMAVEQGAEIRRMEQIGLA